MKKERKSADTKKRKELRCSDVEDVRDDIVGIVNK
jgi:hypothetical protein